MVSCSSNDPDPIVSGSVGTTSVVQSKYKSPVTTSTSGTSITLKSQGIPDHFSPYWPTAHALWEAQASGRTVNPGNLTTQNFSMTIPTNPASAASKEATALGPIGMALNGVAIFNDREGGNVPLTSDVVLSFDRGGAHSGPGGLYHYHVNGDFTSLNDDNLIGFLRDGFPIYGRKDKDGSYPTDLDTNGGHTGATADFAEGIYHYHCSNVNYMNTGVYVLKAGSYHGTKGTFTF